MSNKQKIFGSYESSISLTSITVILIFLRFTSKIVQSILEPVILIQSDFIYREHKKNNIKVLFKIQKHTKKEKQITFKKNQ